MPVKVFTFANFRGVYPYMTPQCFHNRGSRDAPLCLPRGGRDPAVYGAPANRPTLFYKTLFGAKHAGELRCPNEFITRKSFRHR
jgi:hypothetical protein